MKTNQKKTMEMPQKKKPLLRKKSAIPALFLACVLASSLSPGSASAQPAANLIGNPNLETEVAAPAMWNKGGFGENTATFSYVPTGIGGSRTVRVDMSAHTSGDAKWYFNDIPVKSSTTYVFSDSSLSNVPTAVDIRYKVINRTLERMGVADKFRYRYVKLGDVPAHTALTANQFTFTTPPNAVSLTIFHYIDRVGYLTTDNYSLMEAGADGGTTTPDTAPPTVSITSPVNNATVSGIITISVDASDTVGVAGVSLVHSGTNHADIPISTEDTAVPYSFEWNTVGVANGVHMLRAEARDAAGNIATSSIVSVTVNNAAGTTTDTTVPTVSITTPIDSTTVSGTTTTVSMNAADNIGVAGVSMMLDGTIVGAEDTAAPYSFAWNTLGVMNGSHTLAGKARDAAGNIATSSIVRVTVLNATTTADTVAPIVSITAPIDGATVSGTTTVSVTASDNVAIASNMLFINGVPAFSLGTSSPATFNWNTVPLADGMHTLYAVAADAAGNTATSTAVFANVSNY